ncbi:Os03g0190651 [Oryza sativa Japonica Group]|uniref:Os03g0190651 protein n=1 Tax=Oryza sativa subsp. japonica TaxID=39947 RepID=A0A0P0VU58_ORYSJ|nr:Os03g0190651 [Oryza sativa Japonica Group]
MATDGEMAGSRWERSGNGEREGRWTVDWKVVGGRLPWWITSLSRPPVAPPILHLSNAATDGEKAGSRRERSYATIGDTSLVLMAPRAAGERGAGR